MKRLTIKQIEFLIGSLMGDAGIAKRGNSYRVRFAHSLKQKEYLKWKLEVMSNFVNMSIYEWTNLTNGKEFGACSFTTLSSAEFKELYELFYRNGVKIITKDILDRLTPLSLAVWYMDDGCLCPDGRVTKGRVKLSLGKVSLEEAQLVKDYLYSIGMPCMIIKNFNKTYNRGYPDIKLSFPASRKFLKLVSDYILNCMKYKLFIESVTTTRCPSINRGRYSLSQEVTLGVGNNSPTLTE